MYFDLDGILNSAEKEHNPQRLVKNLKMDVGEIVESASLSEHVPRPTLLGADRGGIPFAGRSILRSSALGCGTANVTKHRRDKF